MERFYYLYQMRSHFKLYIFCAKFLIAKNRAYKVHIKSNNLFYIHGIIYNISVVDFSNI